MDLVKELDLPIWPAINEIHRFTYKNWFRVEAHCDKAVLLQGNYTFTIFRTNIKYELYEYLNWYVEHKIRITDVGVKWTL